jgi:type 1 glutamine amidotransferase
MVFIKKRTLLFFGICCLLGCKNSKAPNTDSKKPQLIVFSKTLGYRHASIETGIESIKKLGLENGFIIDATENSDSLISNIETYQAVIFLSPSGDIFNDNQQEAFKNYIHNGGGFVGIHGATTAEYEWEWFGQMIGAYFDNHPKQQNATMHIVNHNHPATSFLSESWVTFDEWYNFNKLSTDINVLMTLDETSYSGGKHGNNHPIAWYQNFEGSRVFYTALGHGEKSYTDPLFMRHILGGINYALGKNK